MKTFKELADEIAVKTWGFAPHRQVKPVHFANGFFRSLCGQRDSSPLLQKAAGGFRTGKTKVTTEALLSDIREKYEYVSNSNLVEQAAKLRASLDLVLGQDRATFSAAPFFSPTLTHYFHTTSDPSDQGTGAFLAEVLVDSDDSSAVVSLRRSLSSGTDNIYFLTLPLLQKRPLGPIPSVKPQTQDLIQNSPILRSIQQAFSTITLYEPRLEKTMFLQRVITLGSFAIFLHMMNQVPEIPGGANGYTPILLCAHEAANELRDVSRATFVRGRQQIERAFEAKFSEELYARGQHTLSPQDYTVLARSWLPNLDQQSKASKKEEKIWLRFEQDFSGFLLGASNPAEAFVSAAVRASFLTLHEGGEDPESFWASLGRMAGLVFPRLRGRGEKYYLPAPQFLDMLVVALLEPQEEISMEEFWDRAWQRFGIIIGARSSQDTLRLSRRGIRQVSPAQLSRNASAIHAELIRMGHAREYADDIAMIRTGGMKDE